MPPTSIATPSSLYFLSPPPSPRILKLLTSPRVSFSPLPTTLSIRAEQLPTSLPILSFFGSKISGIPFLLRTTPANTASAMVYCGLIHGLDKKRHSTAYTLTRGEVRGGGCKPYPQKNLGDACRGSMRIPIRPGGDGVFGPKPKDWSCKINRTEKCLTLSIASAVAASEAFIVEDFASAFEGRSSLTGSFNVTSHLTLSLYKGAILIATQDSLEWPIGDPLPSYGQGIDVSGSRHWSLINGYNLTDVIITGDDAILAVSLVV